MYSSTCLQLRRTHSPLTALADKSFSSGYIIAVKAAISPFCCASLSGIENLCFCSLVFLSLSLCLFLSLSEPLSEPLSVVPLFVVSLSLVSSSFSSAGFFSLRINPTSFPFLVSTSYYLLNIIFIETELCSSSFRAPRERTLSTTSPNITESFTQTNIKITQTNIKNFKKIN